MQYPKIMRKPMFLPALAILVVVVAAAYFLYSSSLVLTVASGDTVQAYYTGSFTNGTVFGSDVGQQPLNFTVGAGQLIKGFDYGVIGMRLNETRTLTITPTEAYGDVNQSLIVQVPLSVFGGSMIYPGNMVREVVSGTNVTGVVRAVSANTATIDFNNPLAGHTLVFQVRIIGIQKK